MLDRLRCMLEGLASEVQARLRARLEALRAALARAGAIAGLYLVAAIIGLAGLLTAVAGACVALAEAIGVAPALGITGGVLLLVAGAMAVAARPLVDQAARRRHEALIEARARAIIRPSDRALRALPPGRPPSPQTSLTAGGRTTEHLAVLGAALFAAATVLGPGRTFRVLRRSLSLAVGAAASLRAAQKTLSRRPDIRSHQQT